MNVKNIIITGKHIKELEEALDVSSLHLQGLLGLYAPTVTRLTSPGMIDKPIDRAYCATIRFLLKNYGKYGSVFPMTMVFKRSSLEELAAALKKSPLFVSGVKLDLRDHAHLGLILFRGFSAARKYNTGDSNLTLPLIQWINIVIHCVSIARADLIQDVILEEARAHRVPLAALLEKGWPPLGNEE